MHHYTYKITLLTDYTKQKYYIGVRTSKVIPEEDKYIGSSKYLNKFLKENPDIEVKKEILKTFDSREAALSHEIYLHELYNVSVNELFWNKSKQTSKKFDTAGTTHEPWSKGIKWTEEQRKNHSAVLKARNYSPSKEVRKKISEKSKGKIISEETRKKLRGKIISEETRKKLSESHMGQKSWNKGIPMSQEMKDKLSVINRNQIPWNKGKKMSEESRKKMSVSAKRYHENRKLEMLQ